jgi:hypothetical protein
MHRKSPYVPARAPARARTVGPADASPFAAPRKLSPGIQRAALQVLRTTARDWGLAASR